MLTGLNLHYTHHELRYCLKQQTEVQIVSQHACSLVNAALLYIVYCSSNENEAVGPSTGSGIHIAEQSDTDFSEQTDLVVEELSQTTTSSTNREYYIKIWYTKEKKVK